MIDSTFKKILINIIFRVILIKSCKFLISNLEAIIVKTSSMGLDPDKHLGKTIKELYPYFLKLVNNLLMILNSIMITNLIFVAKEANMKP